MRPGASSAACPPRAPDRPSALSAPPTPRAKSTPRPRDLSPEERPGWLRGQRLGIAPARLRALLRSARASTSSRFLGAFLREYREAVELEQTASGLRAQIRSRRAALGQLSIPLRAIESLGKFTLGGYPHFEQAGRDVALRTVPQLVRAFRPIAALYGCDLPTLWSDLEESHAHLFQALVLREHRRARFAQRYRAFLDRPGRDPDAILAAFERWCVTGHPLHPTPKSRGALRLDEAARFGPEAPRRVALQFVAIPRDGTAFHTDSGLDYPRFLTSAFPRLAPRLRRAVREAGLDEAAVYVLPIHPWQRRWLGIPPDGPVHDLPGLALPGHPLISFRTFQSDGCTRHVKLPIHACITSAVRQLSARSTEHAVRISSILARACRSPSATGRTIFLRDETSFFRGHKLGVIYRDRLSGRIPPHTLVLPAAALLEESPLHRGRPILVDLVERFRAHHGGARSDATRAFFSRYADLLVGDVLRLLTLDGIGCEAHLQNTVWAFQDGAPWRVILRDAEDLPICLSRLERRFPGSGLSLETWNVSEEPDPARHGVLHALVHAHLSHVVGALSHAFSLPEAILWAEARGAVRLHFQAIRELGSPEDADQDEAAFLAEQIPVKSLLRMKLVGQVGNAFVRHQELNPLSAAWTD